MTNQTETETKEELTDAQKFEDSLRIILAAPKKEVDARLAEKKEQRQKQLKKIARQE